jgi:hypothetical protein
MKLCVRLHTEEFTYTSFTGLKYGNCFLLAVDKATEFQKSLSGFHSSLIMECNNYWKPKGKQNNGL